MSHPKRARTRVFNSALKSFALLALLLAASASARAATRTWDGGGANANWATAANWEGDTAPVAGDDLVFPAGAAQFSATNNFPFLTRFNSITITGGDYVLGGNPVNLSAGIRAESGTQAVNFPINLLAAQSFTAGDGAVLTVNIFVNTNGHVLTLDGAGAIGVIGLITGSGGVTKDGFGAALLLNNNSYTGPTTVAGGVLGVDGSQPNSPVNVAGGILGGTGTVGAVNATVGGVSAGTLTSPTGVLSTRGLKLGPTGALVVKLRNTTAGGGHDQINVTGAVELGGGPLVAVPLPDFAPAVGDAFTVVNNDGSDPVVGTFADLPEGATFSGPDGASHFRISYVGGTGNDVVLTAVAPPAGSSTIRFAAATFQAAEGAGRAVVTVTRAGDTSSAASVTFTTVDDPAAVRCDDAEGARGAAYARCDYATTVETLQFAAGQTSRTVEIPLVDDAHVEGNELVRLALAGPVGATLGTQRLAGLTIADNDAPGQPNPVNNSAFFVRQHYLDFLSREPEAGEPWTRVLNNCPDVNNDPACGRVTVSSSFFRSQEFHMKGYFVYLFYKVSLGRLPRYAEIIPDMRRVTGQTEAEVAARRAAFTEAWVERPDFAARYPAGLSAAEYVDRLLQSAQVALAGPVTRESLIADLQSGAKTRAGVLRALVETREVDAKEFNGAFVAMQYFGYLRRDPEEPGYTNWLNYLNQNPQDFRTMVNGFVNSSEYRLRFGRP